MVRSTPALSGKFELLREFVGKDMAWDSLQGDFVRIYINAFSESELRELAAFYGTPTGQKAIQLLPVLVQQGAEIGQKRMQQHPQEFLMLLDKSGPDEGREKIGGTTGIQPASRGERTSPGSTLHGTNGLPEKRTKKKLAQHANSSSYASGIRESNPFFKLGKLALNQSTNPACSTADPMYKNILFSARTASL